MNGLRNFPKVYLKNLEGQVDFYSPNLDTIFGRTLQLAHLFDQEKPLSRQHSHRLLLLQVHRYQGG